MKSLVEAKAQEEGVGNVLDLFERSPSEGNIEHSIGTSGVLFFLSSGKLAFGSRAPPSFIMIYSSSARIFALSTKLTR